MRHDSREASAPPLPDLPSDPELALTTPRLSLEPVTERHAEELWRVFSDSELHRYVPFEAPTLDAQRERCARWASRRSPAGDELWLNWAPRHRYAGAVIGHFQAGVRSAAPSSALSEAAPPPGFEASLGYVLSRAHQGQGYALEGLRTVIKLLRHRFRVQRVIANIDSRNEASIRLARRLGMSQALYLKDADFFKGSSSDEVVMALELGELGRIGELKEPEEPEVLKDLPKL